MLLFGDGVHDGLVLLWSGGIGSLLWPGGIGSLLWPVALDRCCGQVALDRCYRFQSDPHITTILVHSMCWESVQGGQVTKPIMHSGEHTL